ncbi:MAG: nucleotidyltransferase family protein [Snowella sp.]|nr:nucleotidyltransferase family protein [Snowella sp.]
MSNSLDNIIAVVLAGGFGTRIKHLLPDVPKPMAAIADKPFLGWVLDYLHRQGIDQALLSTGYLAEVIERYAQSQPVSEMELACYPETEPLGTAGGFVNAVNQSHKEPKAWLVLNGDSLMVTDLAPLNEYLNDETVDGVILGVSVTDASRFGSLVYDEQKTLLQFAEKRSGAGVINGGVYLLRDRLIQHFPPNVPLSFEYDVFPSLLQQNFCLKVHPVTAPFLDIGTPESLAQAETFIRQYFI